MALEGPIDRRESCFGFAGLDCWKSKVVELTEEDPSTNFV